MKDNPALLEKFQQNLLHLERYLERNPTRFGEPIDDLPLLKVTRYVGFTRMLIVNYGIVQNLRVVVVNKLRLRKSIKL